MKRNGKPRNKWYVEDGVVRYKPDPEPQPFARDLSSLDPRVRAAIRRDCPEDLKELEKEGFFSIPITSGIPVTDELKEELRYQRDAARDLAKQYRKVARMLRDPKLSFSCGPSVPDQAEIEHMETRARELEFAAKARGDLLRKYPTYPNYANQRIRHLVSEILKHKPDFGAWEACERVHWSVLKAMGVEVPEPTKRTNLSAGVMRKVAEQIRKKEKRTWPQTE